MKILRLSLVSVILVALSGCVTNPISYLIDRHNQKVAAKTAEVKASLDRITAEADGLVS